MKKRLYTSCAGLVCLGLALAGCGSRAAARSSTSRPHPGATPAKQVAPELAQYAALVYPALERTTQEGGYLLSKMKSSPPGSLGDDCTTAGGDFSNYQSSFHYAFVPTAARKVYPLGSQGFKLTLSAFDECGMAADNGSSKNMATAAHDLWSGLGKLSQAQSLVKAWYVVKS